MLINLRFYLLSLLLIALPVLTDAQPTQTSETINQIMQLFAAGRQAEGEALLKSLSNSGNYEATRTLAAIFVKSARTSEAVNLLEPLANTGDSEAQWYLFQTYGLASPPNNQLAEYWLNRSANAGYPKAISFLKNRELIRPGSDGKVSTTAFITYIRATMADKINSFSDKVVACYGASRSTLIEVFNVSLDQCVASLPSEQKERIIPSQTFSQSISSCANTKIFERTGRTPTALIACFAKN